MELHVALQDGTNTYVYGLDLISATDSGGVQTYFLYDGLGSTADLTDGNGNSVAGYSYDVFGAIRSQSGSSSNYWLFTGEQRDADSSLYYLRARYYDPAAGRFLGPDPLSGSLVNAQSQNRYPYARNNPVLVIDPSGLCGILDPGDCISDAVECVGNGLDCTGEVGEYVADKAQDTARWGSNCLDSLGWTCISDSTALFVSYFSHGERRTGPNGFVYYENCKGFCQLVWGVNPKVDAFTPGFIAFGKRGFSESLLCHEYQHYVQSRFFGPLYLPLATTPPFERDAESAEDDKEGHVPFTPIPVPGSCR